jgi:hypothetical protein
MLGSITMLENSNDSCVQPKFLAEFKFNFSLLDYNYYRDVNDPKPSISQDFYYSVYPPRSLLTLFKLNYSKKQQS